MDALRFPVIVEEEESGFVVECPSFQGCYTQGDSYEEALANIRELIRVHLERGTPQIVRSVGVATVEIQA